MKFLILILMVLIANVFLGPLLWIGTALFLLWSIYRKVQKHNNRH